MNHLSCQQQLEKGILFKVLLSQNAAFILLNKLHAYQCQKPLAFYADLEGHLVGFVNFLKKDFNTHFNHEHAMPEPIWIPVKEKILKGLTAEPGDIETELLALIHTEFEELILEHPLSFTAAGYWTKLVDKLLAQTDKYDAADRNIHTLITHNFNSTRFVAYVMGRYAAAIAEEGEASSYWAGNLQHINRVRELPGIWLYKKQLTCKNMLLELISTEIHAAEFTAETDHLTAPSSLFDTTLSVPQLGAFFRLMVEEEIIKTDNKRALMKNVSRVFRSLRSSNPSAGDLCSKFYTLEPAAVSIIQTHLLNMLNWLKKYKNLPSLLGVLVNGDW